MAKRRCEETFLSNPYLIVASLK